MSNGSVPSALAFSTFWKKSEKSTYASILLFLSRGLGLSGKISDELSVVDVSLF
jgi:hypothetical protein